MIECFPDRCYGWTPTRARSKSARISSEHASPTHSSGAMPTIRLASNTRIGDRQLEMGAVGQRERRRAAYTKVFTPESALFEHSSSCRRTLTSRSNRGMSSDASRAMSNRTSGRPIFLPSPKNASTHAKIVVHPDCLTLIPRRPGSIERGQCRRWPVVVGIWRERCRWLLDRGQPPLLLEQWPRWPTGVQQLQRKEPRPQGHPVFVLFSDSVQAHGRDIAPRSIVFGPLHQLRQRGIRHLVSESTFLVCRPEATAQQALEHGDVTDLSGARPIHERHPTTPGAPTRSARIIFAVRSAKFIRVPRCGIQATWLDRVRTTRAAPGTARCLFPMHSSRLLPSTRRVAKGDRSRRGIHWMGSAGSYGSFGS